MIAALRDIKLFSGRRPPPRPARPSRVGTPAPELSGVSPTGGPIRIDVGSGIRVVLSFLTSSCVTCQVFWKELHGEPDATGGRPLGPADPAMVIVTPDPTTEDRRDVARRAPSTVPVVMSTAGWIDYGVSGSPFFVVVVDGVIRAEGTASTWAELVDLVPGD